MYWLVKSEPKAFSIHDLEAMPDKTDHWDGVRNYQARNFMRDDMRNGDRVLFYHSNANPPGVAGLCTVVRESYPDFTAEDPDSSYYDPKYTPDNPRWFMVDIQLDTIFPAPISRDELKKNPLLEDMPLLKRGNRLSVMPIEERHYREILRIAGITHSRHQPMRTTGECNIFC